ncbi:hypothetical protein [Streptomyces osmaniensis]|uniref:Uncharacterized protein n=1 Tax=Streptomyces osmaniensis TaxID=593134 RepID=A0ABP6VTF0_9ACTN
MLRGEDVPTGGDIAQAHGVSVGIAHRAFAQLKNDGLIEVRSPIRRLGRLCEFEQGDAGGALDLAAVLLRPAMPGGGRTSAGALG